MRANFFRFLTALAICAPLAACGGMEAGGGSGPGGQQTAEEAASQAQQDIDDREDTVSYGP